MFSVEEACMETEGYEVFAPQRLTMYVRNPNNSEAHTHSHTHTQNNAFLKNSQQVTNTKQNHISGILMGGYENILA